MAAPRLKVFLVLGFLGLVWSAAITSACPFCMEERGPTLIGDFAQAQMVLLGRFTNPKIGSGGLEEGTTDFIIEKTVKAHDLIKGQNKITLPRYINQPKSKFLIFCDVYKKSIDPYRGLELTPDTVMVKYLEGALAFKDKSQPERLRYCFDFLNCPELEISLDAYREFAKADYKDYKEMAKTLKPEILISWLQDPKTPPYRFGLYASLLGHCGKAGHGKVLREMIDDPEKAKGSGIDGLLAGYLMLQPKKAWTYLTEILKTSKDFGQRYAALRTCRFLYNERFDLIPQKDVVPGVALLLDHKDMADFAIEDLRRWKRWEMTDKVLDLFGKEGYDLGTIKRAILRYALRCPDKRAKTFVDQQRKRDAEWVTDTEELLRLEDPTETPKGNQSSSQSSRPEGNVIYIGLGLLGFLVMFAVPKRL